MNEVIATAAQFACLLEASAAKPGNVSPGRPFRDMRYEDFLASAAAIGPAFLAAGEQPLGRTIRHAIEATRRLTPVNTNLGIVLLLAPLARAAALRRPGEVLADAARRIVSSTTVDDAVDAFGAIRLAAPGGMGKVRESDIADEPTVTLLEAMRLAADRDAVAAEWAHGFPVTFTVGAPAIARARMDGLGWDEAATEGFLAILAHQPDTLIARKLGLAAAREVQARGAALLATTARGTPERNIALERLDADLRDAANQRNPGTTADLTAASLFVVIIQSIPKE